MQYRSVTDTHTHTHRHTTTAYTALSIASRSKNWSEISDLQKISRGKWCFACNDKKAIVDNILRPQNKHSHTTRPPTCAAKCQPRGTIVVNKLQSKDSYKSWLRGSMDRTSVYGRCASLSHACSLSITCRFLRLRTYSLTGEVPGSFIVPAMIIQFRGAGGTSALGTGRVSKKRKLRSRAAGCGSWTARARRSRRYVTGDGALSWLAAWPPWMIPSTSVGRRGGVARPPTVIAARWHSQMNCWPASDRTVTTWEQHSTLDCDGVGDWVIEMWVLRQTRHKTGHFRRRSSQLISCLAIIIIVFVIGRMQFIQYRRHAYMQ